MTEGEKKQVILTETVILEQKLKASIAEDKKFVAERSSNKST